MNTNEARQKPRQWQRQRHMAAVRVVCCGALIAVRTDDTKFQNPEIMFRGSDVAVVITPTQACRMSSAVASLVQSHPVAACCVAACVAAIVVVKARGRKQAAPEIETWQSHVLPHGPLQELAPGCLWHVEGTLKYGPDVRLDHVQGVSVAVCSLWLCCSAEW